jgi:hypothetical protein
VVLRWSRSAISSLSSRMRRARDFSAKRVATRGSRKPLGQAARRRRCGPAACGRGCGAVRRAPRVPRRSGVRSCSATRRLLTAVVAGQPEHAERLDRAVVGPGVLVRRPARAGSVGAVGPVDLQHLEAGLAEVGDPAAVAAGASMPNRHTPPSRAASRSTTVADAGVENASIPSSTTAVSMTAATCRSLWVSTRR